MTSLHTNLEISFAGLFSFALFKEANDQRASVLGVDAKYSPVAVQLCSHRPYLVFRLADVTEHSASYSYASDPWQAVSPVEPSHTAVVGPDGEELGLLELAGKVVALDVCDHTDEVEFASSFSRVLDLDQRLNGAGVALNRITDSPSGLVSVRIDLRYGEISASKETSRPFTNDDGDGRLFLDSFGCHDCIGFLACALDGTLRSSVYGDKVSDEIEVSMHGLEEDSSSVSPC